jgi:hypothetical protein
MARFHISVKPYRSDERPNAKWVLNVWHPDGKRERRFFATKDEALAEQTAKEVEAENFGLRALQIDDRLRLEALDAKEKLAPYGVSLTAVVAEFIRRRGSATVTVDQVAEKFLASRSKLERSEKHLDSLRRLFNRFGKSFPTQRLADLTSDQIEGWLHDLGLGPVTMNTYRSLLNSLFEFGVRKNLCPENPVKAVERMTVKAEEVGILTSCPVVESARDFAGRRSGNGCPGCIRRDQARGNRPVDLGGSQSRKGTRHDHRGQVENGTASLRQNPAVSGSMAAPANRLRIDSGRQFPPPV